MTDYLAALQQEPEDAVQYGVQGMRWGVRRALTNMPASQRKAYVDAKDAKWKAKVEANPKLAKVSRVAARDARKLTKQLKKDYKESGQDIKKSNLARTRYDAELKNILEQSLEKASHKVHGMSRTRLSEVSIHRHPDGTIMANITSRHNAKLTKQRGKIAKADAKAAKKAASMEHADLEEADDDDYTGLRFIMLVDDEGFVDDIVTNDDLEHSDIPDYLGARLLEDGDKLDYGILGMKWGRRRTDAQIAKDTANRKASGEKVTPSDKADGVATLLRNKKTGDFHEKNPDGSAGKVIATKADVNPDGSINVSSAPKNMQPSSPGTKAITGEESSSQRYSRLQAQAKQGKASQMSEQDLKFFNARTEALAKVNKMNESNPSWLAATSKKVLQQAAQNTMQSVADGVAKKYISGPILDGINKAAEKK